MRPRLQRPRLPAARAAALALLAAGCGRCGRPAAAPPERWLPDDARGALVLPKLGEAASQLSALLHTALSVPAAAGLSEPWAALRTQLGFDPLDPAGLAGAGLDPERGAAAAATPAGPVLLVLPLADADRLDALLTRLARERLGAAVREEAGAGAARVVQIRRAAGQPPALAWAVLPGAALVASGPGCAAAVADAAARPESASLLASAPFAAARGALGAGLSAIAFAPGASLAADLPPARDGAAIGLRAGGGGLLLRAALLLPPARAEVWREVAGGEGAAAAGQEELARLPAGLFAAGRFGGDPAALARRVSYALPPEAAARLARARLDLVGDLAAHLAPGAAAGLWLAPGFDPAAFSGGVAAAARDPFRLVHLAGLVRVRDREKLRAGLERLARAGPALGARISSRPIAGGGAWSARVGGGQVSWALEGERLFFAGGSGAGPLAALRAGRDGWTPPTAAARAALASGGAAAVLDFGSLVRSFRTLPGEAFGTGPDGFVVRALVDRFLEPASHLAAASLRLEVLPGAARIDLEVEALSP
jgi:hypothetical protein